LPFRILIVEDQALVAASLADIVQRCGHDVVAITDSGVSALTFAANHCPDLALMDIDLGSEPDGITTAVRLREELGVRSLFLTAHTDPIARDRAQAAWPVGLIKKPYSFRTVQTELNAASSILTSLPWSGPSLLSADSLHQGTLFGDGARTACSM
jgi:CheY-like chemotaxis protein